MSTTPCPGSLVELAARKQLPRYQYIDHATLRWIEANRPLLPARSHPRLRPAPRRLLEHTALPASWLAEPRLADSLHGLRHAMRTAALAALLADLDGLPDTETETLIVAAALHDCRRHHDKDDPGHGARGALWLTQHAETVWEHFRLDGPPLRTSQAATAIRLHERPYTAFTAADHADYARAERLTDLLKAADALDRYRLPKRKWWPNTSHTRSAALEQLRATAFDLVVHSEATYLAGVESTDAVLRTLAEQEVV